MEGQRGGGLGERVQDRVDERGVEGVADLERGDVAALLAPDAARSSTCFWSPETTTDPAALATGAMRPMVAVGVAAVLNLVGAFLSTTVAQTISSGLIKARSNGVDVGPDIVFAGLIGAIVWNITTWYFGLPSSSSHALFGGLVGAAIVGAGFDSIDYSVLFGKVIIPAVLAPLTAGIVAFLATRIAYTITRRHDGRRDGRRVFRVGQVFSSSLVALAHGTNDAQKTMGVITLTLVAAGLQPPNTPPQVWVITACAIAIAIGTYTGGWRIIKTLGTGLTAVKPAQGFAAEVSTASTILASSHLGFALSTTHVASGSVIGSGLGRRGSRGPLGDRPADRHRLGVHAPRGRCRRRARGAAREAGHGGDRDRHGARHRVHGRGLPPRPARADRRQQPRA